MNAPSHRVRCARCGRPAIACWCSCIRRVSNATRVLLLQHPAEQNESKGTAALLAACLSNVELRVGERFDVPEDRSGWALLYPASGGGDQPVALAPPHTLVVLDGTWRKSRKMLHMNEWLQQLPRLALTDLPASRYAIRRSQEEGQRSTLEATALALSQLENEPARFAPLWEAMDAFVALHTALASARGGSHQRLPR